MSTNLCFDMERCKPFKRKSYVAMLLGFCPYHYTLDYSEREIIYGEKLTNLKHRLTYLQCQRVLLSRGVKNFSVFDKLLSEKKWKELYDELGKYNIEEEKVDSGLWRFFRSHSLESTEIGFHSNDIKHRLYLNIDLQYRAFFAKTFIEYCVKNAIPYYFKVFAQKGQTDTIVIYVDSDENLNSTINIINQIFLNNKYFKTVTKEPSPHLYKVNDYIGYGFEPKIGENGEEISFTGLMQKCASPLSAKRNAIRVRMLNDFNNGRIYEINDERILLPNEKEISNFSNLTKNEQLSFFTKYFSYIITVYGNEIEPILTEIEHNLDSYENSYEKSSGR